MQLQQQEDSRLAPFPRQPHGAEQDAGRLYQAIEEKPAAHRWCFKNDVVLTVSPESHHWKFSCDRGYAEWWPLTGKVVFDGKYKRGLFASSAADVLAEIDLRWGGAQ